MNESMKHPVRGAGAPAPPQWVDTIMIAEIYGWTIEYVLEELPHMWRQRVIQYHSFKTQVDQNKPK